MAWRGCPTHNDAAKCKGRPVTQTHERENDSHDEGRPHVVLEVLQRIIQLHTQRGWM